MKYAELISKLLGIENSIPRLQGKLVDECVHFQNVEGDPLFAGYDSSKQLSNAQDAKMYSVACSMAGDVAAEYGYDINKLIGFVIY